MIVTDRLNKAICYFAGGFGYAILDDIGEIWEYKVFSVTFNASDNPKLTKGKEEVSIVVVNEHGHKEMFRRAINKLEGMEGAYG